MEAGFVVSNAVCLSTGHADFKVSYSKTLNSMIPTMGICYMLQYMDKLALSQATLLNIRADLVSDTKPLSSLGINDS